MSEIAAARHRLEADPHDGDARIQLVRLLRDADRDQACAVLSDAPPDVADSFAYRAYIVRFWIEIRDFAKAGAALRALREVGAGRPETDRIAAQLAEAEGRLGAAIALYAGIVDTHYDPVWCRRSLARCQLEFGDAAAAMQTLLADAGNLEAYAAPFAAALLTQAKEGEPQGVKAALELLASRDVLADLEAEARMVLAWRTKDTDLEAAAAILACRAGHAERHAGYADLLIGLLVQAQRFEEAGSRLAAIAECHPDEPFVYRRRGQVAEALGNLDEAFDAFDQGTRRHPALDDLRLSRARLGLAVSPSDALLDELANAADKREALLAFDYQIRTGRLVEAADALAWIETLHGELHGPRATLSAARGDWSAARASYRAVLRDDPANPEAIGELARCEANLGIDGAITAGIARLAALAPTVPVLAQLYVLQSMSGLTRDALATAEAICARAPAHWFSAFRRAQALVDATRFADARVVLAELRPLTAGEPAARLPIATLYWDLGELDEAIAALAPDEAPETRTGPENLQLVKFLLAARPPSAAAGLVERWQAGRTTGAALKAEAAALVHLETFDHEAALRACLTGLTIVPDHKALRELEQRCLVGLCRPREARQAIAESLGGTLQDSSSANVPQELLYSFLGSLINEMMARETEHLKIARAMSAEPGTAVTLLADIVRSGSELTAAAIAYVAMLRRDDRLTGVISDTEPVWSPGIPRLIHQYWDSAEPPPDVLMFSRRLRDMHPDCRHRLWHLREARSYLRENFDSAVARAFSAARDPSVRSDIFRLAVLLREGGVYVEVDDWCRRPIDPLLHGGPTFVAHQFDLGTVGNNFIAAKPGHHIVARCLEGAVEDICAGSAEFPWLLTGPGRVTRAVAAHLAATPSLKSNEYTAIWPRYHAMQFLAMHRMMAHKRFARYRRALAAAA